VIIRTRRLLPCGYPAAQQALSDRVIELRDAHRMTYKAVGEALAAEGWVGARGAHLSAKGAFSVYKKRKAHDRRRQEPDRYEISDIASKSDWA